MKTSTLLLAGAALLGILYATQKTKASEGEQSSQSSSMAPASLSTATPETFRTVTADGIRKETVISSNREAAQAITQAFRDGSAIQPTGYSGPVRRTPEGYIQREQAAYLGGGKYSVATVTVIPKKTVTIEGGRVTAAGIVTQAPVKNAQAIAKYRATRF